jgi:DNA-binding MltR family transcriptional regulator
MAKPRDLHLGDWNDIVRTMESESDRGAAVLAGGFTEHLLGSYLQAKATVPDAADDLFSAVGPLSSFSQRIAVAYAFGFINKKYYNDLSLIRRIRNHFAHYPVDTTFDTKEVSALAQKLSTFALAVRSDTKPHAKHARLAYLFACAMFAAAANEQISKRKSTASAPKPDLTNRSSEPPTGEKIST